MSDFLETIGLLESKFKDLVERYLFLKEENDILLTMGAGNISQFVNYYKEIIQ